MTYMITQIRDPFSVFYFYKRSNLCQTPGRGRERGRERDSLFSSSFLKCSQDLELGPTLVRSQGSSCLDHHLPPPRMRIRKKLESQVVPELELGHSEVGCTSLEQHLNHCTNTDSCQQHAKLHQLFKYTTKCRWDKYEKLEKTISTQSLGCCTGDYKIKV